MNLYYESRRRRVELSVRPHPNRVDGNKDKYPFFDPIGIKDHTDTPIIRYGGNFEINILGYHWSMVVYVPGAYRFGSWLNKRAIAREE